MRTLLMLATGAALSISLPVFAEGDIAAGEKAFKKCKSCHTIKNGDDVIFKGGKIGPNLFGVIGRVAGSEDFKYSASMIAAGEGGLIWTEELLAEFISDPKAFLRMVTGDSKAKSKMSVKAKKNQDDLAAYLASVSPVAADSMEETEGESDENGDTTPEISDS